MFALEIYCPTRLPGRTKEAVTWSICCSSCSCVFEQAESILHTHITLTSLHCCHFTLRQPYWLALSLGLCSTADPVGVVSSQQTRCKPASRIHASSEVDNSMFDRDCSSGLLRMGCRGTSDQHSSCVCSRDEGVKGQPILQQGCDHSRSRTFRQASNASFCRKSSSDMDRWQHLWRGRGRDLPADHLWSAGQQAS